MTGRRLLTTSGIEFITIISIGSMRLVNGVASRPVENIFMPLILIVMSDLRSMILHSPFIFQ